MTKVTLKAEPRKLVGRKVKLLRKSGVTPANIYGRDVKSFSIQVDSKEFREVFKKAGETGIVEIRLGDEVRPALVSDVQFHPASGDILHVDFKQVNLKEKVSAAIPVEIVGESPAEKSGIGTVVLMLQELEVEALPTDLPEKFVVDATALSEVDQSVKVSDLKIGDGVSVKADLDSIVAKVEPPQKEEVVEAPTTQEAESGETSPAEGEQKPSGESGANQEAGAKS
jgi:large subunit ribosomal protein L25